MLGLPLPFQFREPHHENFRQGPLRSHLHNCRAYIRPGHFGQEGAFITCGDADKTKVVNLEKRVDGKDLRVTGNCVVGGGAGALGTYKYGDINIYDGGTLTFKDEIVDFWAKNIVVENNGSLLAGVAAPIGTAGGKLTIHLYGVDQWPAAGVGVDCIQKFCGIPDDTWVSNGTRQVQIPSPLPNEPNRTVLGFFYQYGPLLYDGGKLPAITKQGVDFGFFGYKVLAVSYGGTLRLNGLKGVKKDVVGVKDSGLSWVRLAGTVLPGAKKLIVDRDVVNPTRLKPSGESWAQGDKIVLTTTDYLPGHSEELTITSIEADRRTINFAEPLKYRHQGEVYQLRSDMTRLNLFVEDNDKKIPRTSIETRAAVGLPFAQHPDRFRGPDPRDTGGFPETAGTYFGGHTIARQGFKTFQVQGVEFKQLGQGGRVGHYPVHFHHAQNTPKDTYVKDSSVNESMTRWMGAARRRTASLLRATSRGNRSATASISRTATRSTTSSRPTSPSTPGRR